MRDVLTARVLPAMPARAGDWGWIAAQAAVYIVVAKLALRFAAVHATASPVWPPTGLALAALLVLGHRVWPAILAGAFVVNVTTAGSIASSLAIACGNTLK